MRAEKQQQTDKMRLAGVGKLAKAQVVFRICAAQSTETTRLPCTSSSRSRGRRRSTTGHSSALFLCQLRATQI
jgi:hypothetical protein